MKTIFLAEGQKHVRDALRLMFEYEPNLTIVGEAGTAECTLAQVCQQPPEIILLDWNLPGLHPQRLLAALRQCCPAALILATGVRPEQETVARQFEVDGFLLKQLPPDQFLAELVSVLDRDPRSQKSSK